MKARRLLAPVFASALVFLPSSVRAELDPSFSADGLLVLDGYGGGVEEMIVSGDQIVSTAGGFVFRFSSAGVLDPTFRADAVFGMSEPIGGIVGLASRSGGGYWLGGSTLRTQYVGGDFALIALTSAGEVDTGYGGGDGIETIDLGQDESATSMAIDPSGNILLAGNTNAWPSEGGIDIAVARFTPEGVPDPTFGIGGGIVLEAGTYGSAVDVEAMPTGEPILVGTLDDEVSGSRMFVSRLEVDGDLDPDFAGGGMFVTQAATIGGSIGIAPMGQILVGGTKWLSFEQAKFILVRLTSNGAVDASFGKDGYAIADFGAPGDLSDALVMPDSSVVVAGSAGGDFALTRFTKDGVLDPAFGQQLTNFFTDQYYQRSNDAAYTVVLLPDGRLLVGGASDAPPTKWESGPAWALYKRPLPPCTKIGRNAGETMVGTRRADVLCSLAGDDIVHGRRGADIILGGDGIDRLYGETGRDFLRGDHGQDLLDGGPGSDRCDGGTGKDRMVSC